MAYGQLLHSKRKENSLLYFFSVVQHTGGISTYMLHVSLPFIHFRTTTKIRRVQVISAKFLLVITLITVTDNSIRLLISRLQDLAAQKVL